MASKTITAVRVRARRQQTSEGRNLHCARVLPLLGISSETISSAAAWFFDSALADWWGRSLMCDRVFLLDNFGVNDRRSSQLSGWRWEKLPADVRRFIVQQGLSGKPMEYLP